MGWKEKVWFAERQCSCQCCAPKKQPRGESKGEAAQMMRRWEAHLIRVCGGFNVRCICGCSVRTFDEREANDDHRKAFIVSAHEGRDRIKT